MKSFSIKKFTIYVCLAGAGLILIAALWGMSINNFKKQALSAKGTIISLVGSTTTSSKPVGDRIKPKTTTYAPVVRFTAQNGQSIEFLSDSGTSSPAYSIGQTVEVLYLSSSPEKARINDFSSLWMWPFIVAGIGLVFLALGGGIIMVAKRKGRKNEFLRRNGTPVETDFLRVEKKDLNIGGKNPYKVITTWTDPSTSEERTFTSDNLWHDPSDQIDREKITVFFEKDNPKNYYVDISFLTKKNYQFFIL